RIPVTPAVWEAEAKGLQVPGQPQPLSKTVSKSLNMKEEKCVICIRLVLVVGSFFIVGVLVGHSGIVGMMLGFIKRLLLI
ncbi:hypothetical protein PSU14_21145, partial [Yersinia pestis]|nr:hypothetical protein [Yersinia pestis]